MSEIKITALSPLEGIRKRPGTYIGPVTNPNVLLREVIDNSIDECLGDYTNEIHVFSNTGNGDKYSGCYDKGRGIPITLMMHNKELVPQFKVAVTSTHAGSKFNNTDKEGSVGLNGLGTKAVNALSNEFYIISKIHDDNWDKSTKIVKAEYPKYKKEGVNCYYSLYFEKGKFIKDSVITIQELNDSLGLDLADGYSTYTIFSPDETIFHDTHVSVPIRNFYYLDAIMKYFYRRDNLVVTHQGKKLSNIEFEPYKYTFHKSIELDQWRNARDDFKDKMNKKLSILVTFEFDPELAQMDSEGSINSLASWGKNTQLGEKIVTEGLRRYFHVRHQFISLGLKIKTILMVGEVEFDSQTKTKNTGIPGLGRNDWMKFMEDIHALCKANPEIGNHIALLNEYAASMKSLTSKELIKNTVFIEGETSGTSNHRLIPAKLRDALSENREDCSLFIVEGDSAGKGLIKTRDPMTVGVLPLRGVPVNSTNLSIEEVLENVEMRDLISAIGMGTAEYNTDKVRYSKIIIAADADVDGYKITSLILGTILTHMPFLVDKGMVYVANAPLYRQDGHYIYSEDDLNKKRSFKRFKGLGEMNDDEVHDSLLDPKQRKLIRITPEGADYALRLISTKEERKALMREIGCLSGRFTWEDFTKVINPSK